MVEALRAERGVGGILSLPASRLWPFLSLWTMHVWIYWFNTTPLRAGMTAVWPVEIYGVMTAVLLLTAFVHRGGMGAGNRRTGRLDIPLTVAMCAVSASTIIQGMVSVSSALWSTCNVVVAGVCMAWGYLRWSVLFGDLGIRDAVVCLFGSYVLGSSIKVLFDVASPLVGGLLGFALPVVSVVSLHLVSLWADEASGGEPQRGALLYPRENLGSLGRIALCVFAFCFVYRIAPNSVRAEEPLIVGRLLGHAVEVGFALVALAWVFRLGRSLSDFPQLWRFVFLFLGTSIAADCLGVHPVVGDLCSSVTSSLTVMLLWLFLSDVAHHSDCHPYFVFGVGWSLYVGGRYLGYLVEHAWDIDVAPLALGVALLWFLGVVMAFCLETRDPDIQRVFADLRRKVDPEEFASIDERCGQLAREYELTERELDVLKLLAKGRSKAYIAEALVISENTVRGHARRLYAKLDVHTRDELQGLIGL